jgi:VPDSG-CTERM motif
LPFFPRTEANCRESHSNSGSQTAYSINEGKIMSNSTLNMKNETPVVTAQSRSSLRLAPVLVIAALMAFCPTLMRADTIALSFTGGLLGIAGGDLTVGWAFTLSSSVLVTQLGLWDQDNDGLNASHGVTIWTSAGTPVATTTIPSGTGATLTDGFRYVSIAPFLLPAGSYTIGGFYSADPTDLIGLLADTITTASGVTYDGSRGGGGFAFPTGDVFGFPNSYFGPNFQFTRGTGVPDSGTTFSLLGFASFGLIALRRKLRC